MIVDSQVHVWPENRPDRPWLTQGGSEAHLPRAYTYEELIGEMDGAGVDRAIMVPPSWEGDRADYAFEAVGKYPDRLAIMGRFPVEDPKNRDRIPGWKSQPGMLGVRFIFLHKSNVTWLTDGTCEWFWPLAEKAELPVMIHAPHSVDGFEPVAARYPGVRLIIDHMGLTNDLRDEHLAPTIERIAALARYPNVYVKLSAVSCYSTEPWPHRNIHPHLRRLFDAFGPKRLFWGTDLTRMVGRCGYRGTYRDTVTLFTEHLDFLSAEDRDWIMGRAILECLGWPG